MSNEGPKTESLGHSFDFYNERGKEYVALNREFYSGLSDTGRNFMRTVIRDGIEKKTIADIGCGAGDDMVAYAEMGAVKVIGIEPSHVMLEEARKLLEEKHTQAELLKGAWEQIPLPDGSVDIVTSRYSFHVQQDFDKAFQEVARILKPSGIFLVAAPHPIHDAKVAREQNLKPGELMNVPIFNGKFVVRIPPHSMDDYLSVVNRELFELEDKLEYSMHENPNEKEPTGIVLKFRKKDSAETLR
ncbi:MAG: class I SAM-dependent methyltransferase [Candidatus Colwellbacteria bacterium]|nr:class I SAM-dependent methyltransferase [Candidatus Colwellbacteria bacterium]